MRFEFMTAGQIIVGPGSSEELPLLLPSLGGRALLVHGKGVLARNGPAASLIGKLHSSGLVVGTFLMDGEPHVAAVEEGARQARSVGADMVVGLGGGSVLDAAKAIAGLAVNDGGALRYMEVVGEARSLERPALPIAAIPTTAGTGTEVTRNAVVTAEALGVKASIRHPSLLPRLAVVDPQLTHDLPPSLTASSGMDALTQLIEAYVSVRAQPFTDGFCLEGLERVRWALRRAFNGPEDGEAREAMSTAAILSGLALANAGLGAVHGIAAPLGGRWKVPHGAACAALLPHVTQVNIQALRQRDPNGPALRRYRRVAAILLQRAPAESSGLPRHDDRDTLDQFVAFLTELCHDLGIPRLGTYGLDPTAVPTLAEQAMKTSSTRGNPLVLEQAELEQAIEAAM
ncbi:MAG: iron-containing alcohol dehydrogenase [Armatimonadota bacterium]|nr:iron-containing alcohol dehydrogenase [Armatimonadota bacterium]